MYLKTLTIVRNEAEEGWLKIYFFVETSKKSDQKSIVYPMLSL